MNDKFVYNIYFKYYIYYHQNNFLKILSVEKVSNIAKMISFIYAVALDLEE